LDGHPKIVADRQHTAAKTFGRHTDDGKRVTVDDDSLADGGGIAVPTPLPEPMTDEDSHVFKAGSLWEDSKAKRCASHRSAEKRSVASGLPSCDPSWPAALQALHKAGML